MYIRKSYKMPLEIPLPFFKIMLRFFKIRLFVTAPVFDIFDDSHFVIAIIKVKSSTHKTIAVETFHLLRSF